MSDSAPEEEDEYMPTPVKAKAKPAGKGKATVAASKAVKPAAAAKRSKDAKSKAVRKSRLCVTKCCREGPVALPLLVCVVSDAIRLQARLTRQSGDAFHMVTFTWAGVVVLLESPTVWTLRQFRCHPYLPTTQPANDHARHHFEIFVFVVAVLTLTHRHFGIYDRLNQKAIVFFCHDTFVSLPLRIFWS